MARSTKSYDEEMQYANQKSCCSCPKFIFFLLVLSATVGVLFGFVDIETLENFFTGGTSNGNTDTGTGNNDDTTPSRPPFEYMQCHPFNDAQCCNGLDTNCNLKVDEFMWATVHNANHDHLLVPNHEAPLEQALEAGYRGLMLDVCKCPTSDTTFEITFCHSLCGVGPRDPTEVFANLNTFLNQNPTEIVMINFEMSVGDPTPQEIWDVLRENTGLRQKTYNHLETEKDWPTLGNLLSDNKQLIVFEHNHDSDCVNPNNPGCNARVEPWFTYAVETEFDFDDVDAVNFYDTSCVFKRGAGGRKEIFQINHFVTATFGPSKSSADELNTYENIQARVEACERITKHPVGSVAIDFWQRGDTVEFTQTLNAERGKRRNRLLSWIFG
ncbi:hypothetical protein CTEN210_11803 [Chaetoceros tenuissimus]|uniref:Phosphatidylinositol-specific phospholipase C X domain-containing protein n=1 Tax=Chaetoceros tenuissimus TaxID=426638 RepID=A0AAD3D0F0_9STRA|nr:hypothetical protein CTEN210_11803 [Chaetoceros tenuissimus]